MFNFMTHSPAYSTPGQEAFEAWKVYTMHRGWQWTVKRQRGSKSPL